MRKNFEEKLRTVFLFYFCDILAAATTRPISAMSNMSNSQRFEFDQV